MLWTWWECTQKSLLFITAFFRYTVRASFAALSCYVGFHIFSSYFLEYSHLVVFKCPVQSKSNFHYFSFNCNWYSHNCNLCGWKASHHILGPIIILASVQFSVYLAHSTQKHFILVKVHLAFSGALCVKGLRSFRLCQARCRHQSPCYHKFQEIWVK